MTFDEATNLLLEQNLDSEVASLVVYEMSVLKDTYAPTVEMTKLEKNNMLSSIKCGFPFIYFYECVIHQSTAIKFGTKTTPELYKSFSEGQLIQAWLHPETIKIINEEQA